MKNPFPLYAMSPTTTDWYSYWFLKSLYFQARFRTRLLDIVHADVFKAFIDWIVLARAQHVHHTALFVRTIQQYLLLTTSGNGPISPKKSVSKVLLTISILMDQTTTSPFQRSILHFRSHSNVHMPSPARVESTQNAIKDIKGICVQPVLTAIISASTHVWNVLT